jgi:hypothetical protein
MASPFDAVIKGNDLCNISEKVIITASINKSELINRHKIAVIASERSR